MNANLWRVSVLSFSAAIAGCQSAQQSTADDHEIQFVDHGVTHPIAAVGEIEPPPGLRPELVKPWTGAQLEKAKTPFDQIVKSVSEPAWLKNAKKAAEADVKQPERRIPLAALRSYAAARLAMNQNKRFEAIRRLQFAQTLAPKRPEILKLLGQMYTDSGNKVRGALYLKQSAELDPDDIETLFWLGRYELERTSHGTAIAVLAFAESKHERGIEAALDVLIPHNLGGALQQEGYDVVAIQKFKSYLKEPISISGSRRLLRELIPVARNGGIAWMMVGDAHHRMGQPKKALEAYEYAKLATMSLQMSMDSRLVYTYLKLGQSAKAEEVAVASLQGKKLDSRSIALIGYLVKQGAPPQRLAGHLEERYRATGRPAQMAIAISDLYMPPKRMAVLRDHLKVKPDDRAVFEHLLKQCFAADAGKSGAVEAIRATVAMIEVQPENAIKLSLSLFVHSGDDKSVLDAAQKLSRDEKKSASVQFVQGMASLRIGETMKSVDAIEKSVKANPRLAFHRLGLVRMLVDQKAFEDAGRLIKPLAENRTAEVIELRVKILSETGQSDKAIALLNELIRDNPRRSDLVITKARLQLAQGKPDDAENSLKGAVSAMPKNEELYEELFKLYDQWKDPVTGQRKTLTLLASARTAIPDARITRLKNALQLMSSFDFIRAEPILRKLVGEDKSDHEVLWPYLQILLQSRRTPEANALIEQRLAGDPGNIDLLKIADDYFRDTRNNKRMLQVREQRLLLTPSGFERDQDLARVFLDTDRAEKAVTLLVKMIERPMKDPEGVVTLLGRSLKKAKKGDQIDGHVAELVKRYPGSEAQFVYEWSWVYEMLGRTERAREMMEANQKKHPTHAQTSNHLGYAYANEGIKLKEAEKMIQAALRAKPEEAAYLDSLGWVYYKQGRFAAAETELRKSIQTASHPVILNHLGDTLWRLGRNEEARRYWQAAQEVLRRIEQYYGGLADDPELRDLPKTIGDKVQAVLDSKQPAIAEIAPADQR